MKINRKTLAKLNPCDDRFNNFIKEYPLFNGNFSKFIDLDKIDYDDKIWVAKKILNKNQLVIWNILCAESVLYIYEKEYPNDSRPRECLDLLKTYDDFDNLTEDDISKILKAAANAAYASYYPNAANAAANAAYYAANAANAAAKYAVNAANAANYAAVNAAYAAANYAANNANYAAEAAANYAANNANYPANNATNYDNGKIEQQHLNLEFLKMA